MMRINRAPDGATHVCERTAVVLRSVWEITPSACYSPPPAFRPEMNSVEGKEWLEDFLCVSRVPPSDHGVVAHYLLSDSFPRWLIERFHAMQQRENQTIEQYAQKVEEDGRRAGVSECDLVARFARWIREVSKLSLKLEGQELTAVIIAVAWATSDASAPTKGAETTYSQRACRAADYETAGIREDRACASAAVSANSRGVRPHLGADADKPGDWARALVGGAECSRRRVIEPASGPWSSPVVMVQKKDGSPLLCVDYRELNAVTRVDARPILHIDDTLDAIPEAKWSSTLDLASWQVEVPERDWEEIAFSTPMGLFQFRVMLFGLFHGKT
ncbi:Transposon Ty3-I Gag-Pol polyprotein [Trichinella nativa]|uniref:Transposon Ty3-I Gag-Pol polyprotein n=1 Tax=Trichinella nativa TaxID=6335 RepID=A0A0V1KPB4_9BILA|nr:Transposon Ty3-I Gag-Pol polyprotein [Trichinella nativa]